MLTLKWKGLFGTWRYFPEGYIYLQRYIPPLKVKFPIESRRDSYLRYQPYVLQYIREK